MSKNTMPNMFVGAPFQWPQGTFNLDGQFRGQARVIPSQEISWTINSLGADDSVSVQSNSGHNVMVLCGPENKVIFDHQKKAFTLANPLAGILLLGDHARRITVTNAPSFNGGRIFVADLAENENFGRFCMSKRISESEMMGLVQLAKKTAEMSKQSVAVHTPVKPYYYSPSGNFAFSSSGEFISRDESHNLIEAIPLDEILAVEVC